MACADSAAPQFDDYGISLITNTSRLWQLVILQRFTLAYSQRSLTHTSTGYEYFSTHLACNGHVSGPDRLLGWQRAH